jgi:hypothetical protein
VIRPVYARFYRGVSLSETTSNTGPPGFCAVANSGPDSAIARVGAAGHTRSTFPDRNDEIP